MGRTGFKKQRICNTYCIVDGCSSKKAKSKNLSYHIFPKPKQSFVFVENQFGLIEKLDKREAWINRLGLTRKITETSRICSLHFTKDQFFLPNYASQKARLKKTAVPTQWALSSDSHLKLEQIDEAYEEVLKIECPDYEKAEETISVPSTLGSQGRSRKRTFEQCTGEEKIANHRIIRSNPPGAREDNSKRTRNIQVETGFSSVKRIVPSLYVKCQISERRSENRKKMPGSTCSVKSCNNNTIKCKFSAISFHHFPKRNLFRKQWIRFCQQPKGWTPKPHCVICSVHFEPDAFEQKSGCELLLGLETARTILKPNAVPKILDDLSMEIESYMETESDDNSEMTVDASTQTSFQTDELTSLRNAYKELENKYHAQERLITVLRNGNKSLLTSTVEKDLYYKNLEKSKEELEKKLKMFENSSVTHAAAFNSKIKQAMSKTLTANQVDTILGVKKKVRWSRDEYAKALSLRYLSRKAYSFMRGENFPLPHSRTLERYAQMIDLRGGLLKDVLQFLKIASMNMSLKERAVVLVHAETKVKRIYEYDRNCDEIIGPHDYVRVVTARSLFGNWKQPIYVAFDQTMSNELLLQIISALHDISFDVVAVVVDCESANDQDTLRELNVSFEKSYFHHPATNEKIFCFPDAPQLLERIRNWFLNTGFHLSTGQIIEKDLLEELISQGIPDTEASPDFTLSEKHLKVERDDKQNATLASQLFSNFTAAAVTNHSSSEESENLAFFIQLVNDWFEIMSSTDLKESHFKKPFRGREEQAEKLEEIYHVFENMLCIGKNSLQVFQKNILLSLTSLEQLFIEMTGRYGINSISTSKLNQDVVQKLIVQLRGRGGLEDNPTPMNLLHRLRMEILGKTPGLVQTKTDASQSHDKEEYLIAKVFSVAEVEPAIDILDNDMAMDDDFPSDLSIEDRLPSTSSDMTVDDDIASASSDMKAHQIEEEGLSYLSRWLAEKFSEVLPESGSCNDTSAEDHSYQANEGLTEPSKNLLKNLKILEMHFNKINKGQFFSKTLVLKRMLFQLKKVVNLPEEITRTFLQQRILIRLKKLNQIIRSNEIKKKGKISVVTKSKKVVVLPNRLLKFTKE